MHNTDQPNILLITDDQHRWDFYGANNTVATLQTPNMDRLRHEGTTLTNAWSNCPVCIPCRFTWYYGLYASQCRAGLLSNSADWRDDLPSMPQHLQNAGYHTALVGKLHSYAAGDKDLTDPAFIANTKARGLDDVFEVCGRSLAYRNDCHWTHHLAELGLLEPYRRDLEQRRAIFCWNETYTPSIIPTEHQIDTFIADHTCRWIEQYQQEKPFFLHASFCGPHFPLDPPEEYFNRFNPADMPPPAGVEDQQEIRYWQEQRAAYCGLIALLDDQIGRVLDAIEQRGLLEDTIIIYTTDHGDRIGDQGSWHKSQPQDGSCRTPVFVRYPKAVPANVELQSMTGAVDLPVSIMRMAGIDAPLNHLLPESPGVSWWEHVQGNAEAPRQTVYAEHMQFRMVVDQQYKYVRRPDGSESLFDRLQDPDDLNDLIANHTADRDTLDRMRLKFMAAIEQCVAPNVPDYWIQRESRRANRLKDKDIYPRIKKEPTSTTWD